MDKQNKDLATLQRTGATHAAIKQRLEALRAELRAGRTSYGEIVELQSLAEYIDAGDVELLEAAGVPEFHEDGEEVKCYECLNK